MNKLLRTVGRISLGMIVLAVGVGTAAAQGPGGAMASKGLPKVYTNRTYFHLPIDIAEKDRPAVREVVLWAKEPDGPWQKKDTASPAQHHFVYNVGKEGEYWFSVVTVDQMGRPNPVDVTREAPGLVVVVDVTPPVVEIMPSTLPNGQPGLRCLIKDSNADYQKLQLSCQTGANSWQPLEPMPGVLGQFRLPPGVGPNVAVRYVAEDRARNKNSQDVFVTLPNLGTRPTGLASPAAPGNPPGVPLLMAPGQLPLSQGQAQAINPDTNSQPGHQASAKYQVSSSDVVPVSGQYGQDNVPAQPSEALNKLPGASTQAHDGSFKPNVPPAPINVSNASPLHKTSSSSSVPNRQLINTPFASIEYRLDKVGPSGVSKVEVWVKAENAASWQRLAVDADRKSPADIQLPHEGLFGIRFVVTNGNGFGGNPPQPNDQPTTWIEVDSTAPFAQLHPINQLSEGDVIDIHWTATDKNLGTEPITLYYAMQRNGPWQPVARNLPNTGSYNWHFPRDIGSQFFVRLEVTDEAGNTSRSDLTSPVQLDLSEPQAQVVGVTGVAGKN